MTDRGERVPCAECQAERDETGLDGIWCSSDECYVLAGSVETDEEARMMLNGYSIYVAAPSPQRANWIVRVYRDSDDFHIHSAEGCDTLSVGMREAERAITQDVNKPTIPDPPPASVASPSSQLSSEEDR